MTKGLVHRKPRIIFLEQATIWAAKQSMICQTVNLSETGLLLIPPYSSEPGLNLRVDIPLPGLQRPLAIPAVLVREGEHDGDYVWGVRFELISADAQKFLRQFLEEQMAKQSPEKVLEQLPAEPLQTSVPQQVMITPVEPVVQATTTNPARPKPIDRSAVRRVPVKRRGTGSQPAIARDVTGPHPLLPQEVQAADPQPIIALEPEDLGSQPDVALASPPPSRIPTYSGPLDGEAPPVTAPQIIPSPKPLAVEPPLPAPPPSTGSHPVVSPAQAAVAPPPVDPAPATPPASPATEDEPQLSVTMPADELLLDRPPVQEEGTPIFDDVPEWSDKSDVPRSGKDRDLLEEVDKADNKLDDIFDDAIKQLNLSDSWAERGFSKKNKKKKKGWF
jgi:PilZ domain